MDSLKDEMNQADIAALHHFYSRHVSDIPDDQALTELFAQVNNQIMSLTPLAGTRSFLDFLTVGQINILFCSIFIAALYGFCGGQPIVWREMHL